MAHRNRWFTYQKWWFSIAILNYQRVLLLLFGHLFKLSISKLQWGTAKQSLQRYMWCTTWSQRSRFIWLKTDKLMMDPYQHRMNHPSAWCTWGTMKLTYFGCFSPNSSTCDSSTCGVWAAYQAPCTHILWFISLVGSHETTMLEPPFSPPSLERLDPSMVFHVGSMIW